MFFLKLLYNILKRKNAIFRIFVNKMCGDGLLNENPFDKVKIGRVYTHRGFLTIRELKSLYLNFEDCRDYAKAEVMRQAINQ